MLPCGHVICERSYRAKVFKIMCNFPKLRLVFKFEPNVKMLLISC